MIVIFWPESHCCNFSRDISIKFELDTQNWKKQAVLVTHKWLWDVMGLQTVILSPSDSNQHLINRCYSHIKLQIQ